MSNLILRLKKFFKRQNTFGKILILLLITLLIGNILFYTIKSIVSIYEDKTEVIDEYYKHNVHISELDKKLEENNHTILSLTYPDIDLATYMEAAVQDESNKIETYKIYRNTWEDWKEFKEILEEHKEKMNVGFYQPKDSSGLVKWAQILLYVLIYGFLFFLLIRMSGMFGSSLDLEILEADKNKVRLKHIGGLKENKEELSEIVNILKDWNKYEKRGVRLLRGILFTGPPGVGKTMIAKALAGESGIDFFVSNGGTFRDKYFGQSARNVQSAFKKVRSFIELHEKKLGVLFIDEIESVLTKRGGEGSHFEDVTVVNAFLQELDGIKNKSNVIVIGATNFADSLDEAALSRFDRTIYFPMPDLNDRKDIIQKIIDRLIEEDKSIEFGDIDIDVVARKMVGSSGRDIETIINLAHRNSVLKGERIETNNILDALDDNRMGRKRTQEMSNDIKERIIYHELGHALLSYKEDFQLDGVNVTPRNLSLGQTMMYEKEENPLKESEDYIKDIRVLVAGRQAEKVFMNNISTGASNDYERATQIAWNYFLRFNFEYNGFSLGIIPNQEILKTPYGVELLKDIQVEVKKMIIEQETYSFDIIKKNKKKLEEIASILREKEYISGEEFINMYIGRDKQINLGK